MLEELEIRDLGPIRHALLTPAVGMTAITGETGAGKSMLLSAIKLISGGAADAGRVSADAKEAWAQGVFAVSGGVAGGDEGDEGDEQEQASAPVRIARDAGIEPEDGELFLSRTVPVSGRSRAVVNGRSVPRAVLGALSGELVTIHGQADQLRIASPARQREFLDSVAGDDRELADYRKAWDALQAMDGRLERLRNQEASARQQADYLRESIERINRVDPQPGEDEELKAKRSRIENAADIAQGVGTALGALDASQMDVDTDALGAGELINHAAQSLRAIRADGDFSELADRLDSINADLSDVVYSLSRDRDVEGDVADLDEINARIHELGELTRRWGPTLGDVIEWRDKAVFEVEDLDASPEKVAELEGERKALYAAAMEAADRLGAARTAAAASLASTVTGELSSLAMDGAVLEIRVRRRGGAGKTATWPLDANGTDDIAFLFTPYEGAPELPMGKSASGGELSRLMLAMELAAADRRSGSAAPMTFIFDEVDAGVGGKTAVELGRRLARLARTAQVVVVTHLAQVASWADAQFVVTKEPPDADDDAVGVVTTVAEVRGDERVREIARMLSGSESEASLDHARELLASSSLD
ncbi:MAG: DNA repair protein RecN [Bifidobacterium scardovii]|uniref:DNA repair protein RecN n=1 Tax=Bifidobacterium scardovii TaxID=158787 RepID=UPI0006655285|nr:DNA repair protein RecN [Bifidobacterium scardovii]MBS6947750.1 DNA repair protein RecN [Bifidobacterium scardovii]MDU3736883.1 DNA repair protein RecN [Bifidobacterium scardovii]MDU5296652.1 DNA repair protein RecN [Bifidobacterium scardovii]MDU5610034.1 DNA repair protein RecN [Bifidobacterium scardovii]MDU5886563.1 DNA repair protein RecN [Bifidobacterium scardovii]